ncbi:MULTISPECIES: NADAR family protein [unclassified Oleiphilus]|uniref:NADAR family protein n=1 Tax=unclassified Oleiphilus TaxID=2631174 RepID=UPI0007C378CB|nr:MULTISPECIES: NADAR family protein [unclassified Oleiphilus]KZY45316.1 GTP cyclohydrolase [Oleiphilus sp. HI0050]KZY76525.1 GTP cyclohydrolase [Oleiphilus sp. HI0068]KZY79382.1 GTP cyclohydrolase [Oleiphilus sp. HI0069]KZY86076.1 GTP cyclohydrolase [Oleiphilus sp. HI0072]KZZ21424.1 GTP cyclohydrolase [Oleiphilus sp. HI0078]KZZ47396.1 GTP cyclohydrolase [Oleiphilus sp. HI0085]
MLFPDLDEDALFLSRSNEDEALGTHKLASFLLEGLLWPSIEHYYQAMKFQETSPSYFEKIRKSSTAKQARRMGRSRFHKVRKDWAQVKRTVMTRAVYTYCRSHPQVAQLLLDSGSRKILENSQYDYYWGCGRDRRAENTYGKVLMDVRSKLNQEGREKQN